MILQVENLKISPLVQVQPLLTIPQVILEEGGLSLLIGRNGSGKTSLFRTLLGLQQPLSGSFFWSRRTEHSLAYLPEILSFGSSSLTKNWLRAFGGNHRKQEEEGIWDVSDCIETPLSLLSKGQKQRVFLKLCLSFSPSVLLLDEPYSGLDPWAQMHLNQLFLSLLKKGKTLILSTHAYLEDRLSDFCQQTFLIENRSLQTLKGNALKRVFADSL